MIEGQKVLIFRFLDFLKMVIVKIYCSLPNTAGIAFSLSDAGEDQAVVGVVSAGL